MPLRTAEVQDNREWAQAHRFIFAIAAVVFTVEFAIMIVLDWSTLSHETLLLGLIDASVLTFVSAPLIYGQAVRPFIKKARYAERHLEKVLRIRDEQARALSAALAQQSAHKFVLDRHAIVSETDAFGNITYANDAMLRVTGYSLEELTGQNYRILNSGQHTSAFWRDMYDTMRAGGVWQGEICNKRKDGTLYWAQATNSAMRDENGAIKGYVSVRIDITQTKLREQALEAAQDQLQQERAKAEAASVAKTNFLSTMSHEMRTPLNGVLGALDLLRDTGLDEKQQELVNIAHESGDALLVHINDVLDFSKMEAGKLDLEPAPFNLGRLVSSVLNIVAPQAEQRGNKLVSAFKGEVPAELDGDRIRVRQVLLNLVSNANKFTKGGTITVHVDRIGGDTANPELEISVQDSGIGIPKERLKDLFQEFTMLDSSYTRKTSGTGLGLAISKRLIEAMGGTIGVDSVVGEGSRFWFRVALPGLWTSNKVEEETKNPARMTVPKLNILLADDNVTNQVVASRMLVAAGHQVTTVNNGREALEAAGAQLFDVLLTDISMPEIDGIEATKRIRKLAEPYCSIPIVALTANAISGDRERFLAAGMNEYLTKPLRRADIEACLAGLFAISVPDEEIPAETPAAAPASQPAAEKAPEAPIIDPTELERLAEETAPEIVPIVVDEYLAEMKRRLDEILAAMKASDFDQLQKVAHAIAGASASAGARRLREVSKRVELDCMAGENDKALTLAETLPSLIAETDTVFRNHISHFSAPPPSEAA